MTKISEPLPVKRTERGWPGHYICADRCIFRRNTLLECGEVRVIISSVGNMRKLGAPHEIDRVGCDRHYETQAFHATFRFDFYWDIVVGSPINFKSPWAIDEKGSRRAGMNVDNVANDMHEAVVNELSYAIAHGETYEQYIDKREYDDE